MHYPLIIQTQSSILYNPAIDTEKFEILDFKTLAF